MPTRVRSRRIGTSPTYLGTSSVGVSYNYSSPFVENCVDITNRGPPYRSGGNFTLKRSGYDRQDGGMIFLKGLLGSWYSGGFITAHWGANPSAGSYPLLDELIVTVNHNSDGAIAWNRFKPGKPVVDLGQAIIELRQIPTIPELRRHLGFFKDLGGNYLNLEFGWKPFLNDLKKVIGIAATLDDRLKRLKRNNGRWVRREGTLENSESGNSSQGTENGFPSVSNGNYQNSSIRGQKTVFNVVRTRRWFVARWRYWIPDLDSAEGEKRIIRKLIGLSDPTPSLLWEVLPWSWLADWFSNIGDVLSNVSGNAAENLVARYAYNMTHHSIEEHVESVLKLRHWPTGSSTGGSVNIDYHMGGVLKREIKLRTVANPFGFGLTFDSLSAKQMLILAALGVSRR